MYSNTISLRYFFPRARILNEIAEFEKMPLNRKTLVGKQLQLWTIKDNKYTFNLAQWSIININTKSIAYFDNQRRI